MVMVESEIGASLTARPGSAEPGPAAESVGCMAGRSAVDRLDSLAANDTRKHGPPLIGARMGKDPPEQAAKKADDDGSGSEKSNGTTRSRPKAGRSSTAFDLWLQRELQDMFADVSREPVPDELMRLIDESKAKK
jgi:hypothetical protein